MINLLQIVDTVNKTVAAITDTTKKGSISIGELLTMGGWVMIPLSILFLATVFVFFERFIAIRKASRMEGNFMNIIRDHIISGNVSAARS
ncbi:MAG: MotA/TolQ/ExbB proton channel family protein, partial [Flavisolibacter sp.]